MPAPPPPSPPSLPRALALFRTYAALVFAFAWVPVAYTSFTVDRGFTPSQYADFWAAYYVAMVLAEVPCGRLADRLGQRPLLVAGPLCMAACFGVLARAEAAEVIVVAMAVMGAGHAMVSGADSAWLYELLVERGRRDAALAEESVAHRWRLFGVSAADLAGGLLAVLAGTVAAFDASALLMLGAAACAWRLAPNRRAADVPRPTLSGMRAALGAPGVVWVLAWYATVFVLLRMGFHLYQPTLLAGRVELLVLHGAVFAALNLTAGLSVYFVGPVHRRLGERATACGVVLLMAASFAGLGSLAGVPAGAALLAVQLGFFAFQQVSFGFLQPVGRTALNHRIPSSDRTSLISAQSMLGRLAVALLFLLGRWDEAFTASLAQTYRALAVLAALLAVLLFATYRGARLKRGRPTGKLDAAPDRDGPPRGAPGRPSSPPPGADAS